MSVKKFSLLPRRPVILALVVICFFRFGVLLGDEFRITSVQITNANVRITWDAPGGSNYVVQSATNLTGGGGFIDVSPLIFVPGAAVLSTNYTDPGGMLNWASRF